MDPVSQKWFFTFAATFNWLVGLVLFVDAGLLLELFHVTPLPAETPFLRLFAGLVFVFGLGYYAAGSDLRANAPVIRLGAIAKLVVVAIAISEVVLGNISWQLILLAAPDLVFAVLFLYTLKQLNLHRTGQ